MEMEGSYFKIHFMTMKQNHFIIHFKLMSTLASSCGLLVKAEDS
jgi:hypothetical protein